MTTHPLFQRMRSELGGIGLLALGFFAAAALFLQFALKPLEARNDLLQQRLAGSTRQKSQSDGPGSSSQTAAKLAALYGVLETRDQTTDFLTKLNTIGGSAGVELRAAE